MKVKAYQTFHDGDEESFYCLDTSNVAEIVDNVQDLPGVPVLLLQLTGNALKLARYLQQAQSHKFCFACPSFFVLTQRKVVNFKDLD